MHCQTIERVPPMRFGNPRATVRKLVVVCSLSMATAGCATMRNTQSSARPSGIVAQSTDNDEGASKFVLALGLVLLVIGVYLVIPVLASDT